LLEMLAKGANLKPRFLIGQLGDCHLYNNHIDQANEYISRPERGLPLLELKESIRLSLKMDSHNSLILPDLSDIKLVNYNPLPAIKADLSVGK